MIITAFEADMQPPARKQLNAGQSVRNEKLFVVLFPMNNLK